MPTLVELGTGHAHPLGSRCLIGRSSSCGLRIPDGGVSGEHAVLAWQGEAGWCVQDLGSRNGTWVGDRRLTPGEWVALPIAEHLQIGGPSHRFRLANAGSPVLSAIDTEGRELKGEDGFLVLAEGEEPVLVFEDAQGRWVQERDGVQTFVTDGESLLVGTERYRLVLPAIQVTTTDSICEPHSGQLIGLSFRVSRHEEQVDLSLILPDGTTQELVARSHTYLLLVLARARLKDREEGCPPSEEGWLYKDDLERLLGRKRTWVNLAMFRARQQLAAAGVQGAGDLIEWRMTSREVRLGVSELVVE